jgi:V/A-type H+-transporting ATPase subunit C
VSEADFAYLNARVRAVAVDLLPPGFYEQVRVAEGIESLVDALLASAYAPMLREELAAERGLPAIERAVRRRVSAMIAHVHDVAPLEARGLLDIQFRFWDAANVLTIIRGVAAHAERGEILAGFLPASSLPEARLAELAAEPGLAELADTLTTWDIPFTAELRQLLRAAPPRADVAGLEAAVNAAFFRWARSRLGPHDDDEEIVLGMLRRQIDLANVTAALDGARHRERGDPVEDRPPIAGGRLGTRLPRELASSARLTDALVLLGETYFAPGIERAARSTGGGGNLSVVVRFLEGVVVAAGCRLYHGDPLSVAVALGFLWRAYNELVNLRVLARGKVYQLTAEAIAEELIVA